MEPCELAEELGQRYDVCGGNQLGKREDMS
jgi:hypothetical protein